MTCIEELEVLKSENKTEYLKKVKQKCSYLKTTK